MNKTNFTLRTSLRFKRFSRKGYALFAVLGREVLIGTLSVCTLAHAKAEGISTDSQRAADTLSRDELRLEEVVVTGSRAPITASEQARIVSVITRDDINRAAAESVNDVLKLATGVDVRQRGGFGVQTDISILGGTFDQIAILLNGVNISNPQTGHLSADFPVSLSDIERIEILEGAAAHIYGSQAFNGAINIVTSASAHNGCKAEIEAEGGSFGTFGLGGRMALGNKSLRNAVSASYKQSDGGTDNSYFRKSQAFYQGSKTFANPNTDSRSVSLAWQLGTTTQRYGANTFYSAAYPNQYESTLRLFATIKAEARLGNIRLSLTPYWTRNHDHFQLIRNSAKGENFHRGDVLGTQINAYADWTLGHTAVGAEIRSERILSSNLGWPLPDNEVTEVWRHKESVYSKKCRRTDSNIFLEHNVVLKHFTVSAGVVANRNTGYDGKWHFFPGIDISYRPSKVWTLTASWNTAFRMPTFTDLFYKSPTQMGNIGLEPEKTQSWRIAAKYSKPLFSIMLTAFSDHATNMIDWVMYDETDIYHSANFRLTNRGLQLSSSLDAQALFPSIHGVKLKIGYTYISQQRHDDTYIYKSNYAMEYLRHKFTATLSHAIVSHLSAAWSLRWQQRIGSYIVYENNVSTGKAHSYSPYALLDLKLLWTARHYDLSLSFSNLTSHRYYDLGNVIQPGLWIMAGAKVKF